MVTLNNEMNRFAQLKLPEGFVEAMAYVPWQELSEMYRPEAALECGTLFPELDKPFKGKRVSGGCNNV